MGLSGISIWQLLVVLLIMSLLFGTNKLRNLGKDLGAGLRSFRQGLQQDDSELPTPPSAQQSTDNKENDLWD